MQICVPNAFDIHRYELELLCLCFSSLLYYCVLTVCLCALLSSIVGLRGVFLAALLHFLFVAGGRFLAADLRVTLRAGGQNNLPLLVGGNALMPHVTVQPQHQACRLPRVPQGIATAILSIM